MPNERIIWAAGFIDGEGSIGIYRGVALTVGNTDKRPLLVLQELFGGSLYHNARLPPEKPVWFWNARCRVAARALELVEPYLVVKREQARLALAFQDRRGSRGRPPSDREADAADRAAMKTLDKRGVHA